MFSGTGSPMTLPVLPRELFDVTGSQKSKMVATKPAVTHISACRQDSNEIPTATPMFSRMGIPMVLLCILSVTTESQKSKMAAPKRLQRMTQFKNRHLGFMTSGYDGQCTELHHWNARPRKQGCSRWHFVLSCLEAKTWVTFCLVAAILDF